MAVMKALLLICFLPAAVSARAVRLAPPVVSPAMPSVLVPTTFKAPTPELPTVLPMTTALPTAIASAGRPLLDEPARSAARPARRIAAMHLQAAKLAAPLRGEVSATEARGAGADLQILLSGGRTVSHGGLVVTDPVARSRTTSGLSRRVLLSERSALPRVAVESPKGEKEPGRLRRALRELRSDLRFPRSLGDAKALFKELFAKYGWKAVAAVFAYYLIRDTIFYIVLPYLIFRGVSG